MLTNEEITQRIAIVSWEDKEPNTANSKSKLYGDVFLLKCKAAKTIKFTQTQVPLSMLVYNTI